MYSSNPFPSSPNNVFSPPNFLFDHEKDCSSFNYHQNINIDPFFSGDCFHDPYTNLAPPSPAMDNNITTNKQDICRQLFFKEPGLQTCDEDQDDLLESAISSCKKKSGASRKDGHSKIYTAQGPRDRRVRLSIDISRKFFCLQDLLGFDKASQTLDWLFSKCKPAIKELVEETNHKSSSTAAYQSKTSFLEAIIDGCESEVKSEVKDDADDGKRKKIIIQQPIGGFLDHNFGREQSRSVARVRAKERMREKMRIKQLDDELKNTFVHDDFDYQNFTSSAEESQRVISAYPGAW